MKTAIMKRLVIIALVITISAGAAMPVFAANPQTPRIRIDGEFVQITGGQAPVIENGRTLVPLRDVMEPLGFDIEWTPPSSIHNGEVTLTKAEWQREAANRSGFIRIEIDSALVIYRVADTQTPNTMTIDVPARTINGRTMVPVRAIAELTGYTITWDNQTFIVDIFTSESHQTAPTAQSETNPLGHYDIIERHDGGIVTIRTNTGHEIQAVLDRKLNNESLLHMNSIVHGLAVAVGRIERDGNRNIPHWEFPGAVVNISRVTSQDLQTARVVEDLGNIALPDVSWIRLVDLAPGYYRVTLINTPDGFDWHSHPNFTRTREGTIHVVHETTQIWSDMGINEFGQPVRINKVGAYVSEANFSMS